MRLSLALFTWPKKRPNGNIWIGKNRMVLKVYDRNLKKLQESLDLEKRNIQICMNPYFTPEQERLVTEQRKKEGDQPEQLLFKLRKAKAEASCMAPTFAEDNIRHMQHNVPWDV
jgi:hypothetical protein